MSNRFVIYKISPFTGFKSFPERMNLEMSRLPNNGAYCTFSWKVKYLICSRVSLARLD